MAMADDEALARKLQAEFDEEQAQMIEIEENRTSSKHHTMSDSDGGNDSDDLLDTTKDMPGSHSGGASNLSEGKRENDASTSSANISADLFDADTDIEEEDDKSDKNTKKPLCKYGSKCYRKNPSHIKEFYHPSKRKPTDSVEKRPLEVKRKHTDSVNKHPIPEKRKKYSERTPHDVFMEFQPFSFFLTKVKGIPDRFNNTGAFSLKDILSQSMGILKESCHFNFMFDMQWLISQYPEATRKLPILLVHGEQGKDELMMKSEACHYQNISLCRARLDIPYGTHHTKMMLLLYKSGMRVVISTANLIPNDWHQKTQGLWVSPVFPRLSENGGKGDSLTGFKTDLLQYIAAYKSPKLTQWEKHIQAHDMSSANVHLIGSVPGRFTMNDKYHWGHLKLKKILSQRGPEETFVKNWPVSAQFSSIGSLGQTKDAWLFGEFGESLSSCKKTCATPLSQSKCHLIYPSVDNIRLSLEGYNGGTTVPYSIKTALKQVWLTQFLCQWQSEGRGRTRAVPHIKSYSRFSPDGSEAAWFMVTSANLSKAAWGAYEKQKSQLMIRSYELGVLFLPQYFGLKNSFPVTNSHEDVISSEKPVLPLPYDLPPVSYVKGDRPWFIDVPCVEKPDTFGTKWCPNL